MEPVDVHEIERLKAAWDARQPLSPATEERLWRKLRLEWDYHSNHIEGNTLTYGETELLLLHGETRGSHTLREYQEMKAHDVAIEQVRRLAREARALTEAEVRGLNQLILVEPFWSPAMTASGEATRKQIVPGQYKTQPNNVRSATGEMFYFADPMDVPQRMHAYMQQLNSPLPSGEDLLVHLARLHHEFVVIHPFDDGNGRVGRLVLNYALMKTGYLPLIIRTEDKGAYLSALHRADASDRDYAELAAFLGAAVLRSLRLGVSFVS